MYLPASSYTKIFLLPESSGLKSPYSASVGVYNIRPLWDSVSQHLRMSAEINISNTQHIQRHEINTYKHAGVFICVS